MCGRHTGTTTPNPSSGTRPRKTSSRRSGEAAPRLPTTPNPRHTTSDVQDPNARVPLVRLFGGHSLEERMAINHPRGLGGWPKRRTRPCDQDRSGLAASQPQTGKNGELDEESPFHSVGELNVEGNPPLRAWLSRCIRVHPIVHQGDARSREAEVKPYPPPADGPLSSLS